MRENWEERADKEQTSIKNWEKKEKKIKKQKSTKCSHRTSNNIDIKFDEKILRLRK